VGDGICPVTTARRPWPAKLLEFEWQPGIALNLEDDNVGAVLMGEGLGIQEGSNRGRPSGRIAEVPVGEAMSAA